MQYMGMILYEERDEESDKKNSAGVKVDANQNWKK